jgi:hypothetical protein
MPGREGRGCVQGLSGQERLELRRNLDGKSPGRVRNAPQFGRGSLEWLSESTTGLGGALVKAVVAVLPNPELQSLLPGCTFADAYRVATPRSLASLRELSQAIISATPLWAKWLMQLRNVIVRPLGLKTEALEGDSGGSGSIGMFPVLIESQSQMVLGLDDRHLDFRIVIDLEEAGTEAKELTLTTLVRVNNRLGHAYLATILPFHRLIVRSMLSRAARAWRS